MLLRQDINDNFLNLFTKVMENEPLENDNKLNVFVLKISNKRFNTDALLSPLGNALVSYALSRHTYDELYNNKEVYTLFSLAKERLRKSQSNQGELGELLLYCLLEAHLHAPKLLTKLELKTAANDYVKGADGVHLLKIDDSSYQIIFGESKLYADLNKGIKAAFESISTMLENNLEKIQYEINLVNANLLKESVSDVEAVFLKKILIPTENDENLNVDYSFGIFLGFDLKITDDDYSQESIQFREHINNKVKTMVSNQITTINNYLHLSELKNYVFYFYVMPFPELNDIRTEIINKLKS